jgi:hypothetical protein
MKSLVYVGGFHLRERRKVGLFNISEEKKVIEPAITFSPRRQEKALRSKDRLGLHLKIVTIDRDG